mgnify:CR=1 FL=1
MDLFSFIANAHPQYIEQLYQDFKSDPNAVEENWKSFFEGFDFAATHFADKQTGSEALKTGDSSFGEEVKVYALIQAFRKKGHLLSDTNPIRERRNRHPHLKLTDFQLSQDDLDKTFAAGKFVGLGNAKLKDIIDHVEKIYTGKIGFEYAYIEDPDEHEWLRSKIEDLERIKFDVSTKRRILSKLNETVVFENFLNKKYVGQKRFSLEGGESTIPAIDAIIHHAGKQGTKEIIFGMAHRGRLNMLANIMGKTYEHIFNEFEGQADPDLTMGDGDVKYHLGYSSHVDVGDDKKVYIKLVPNPSHLECVDAVVEGFVRGSIDAVYDADVDKVLPVLIHGDAAVVGQGVVYETVQMSQLAGYHTGGTIHFVINNQIGFTTDFYDARSSTYSTAAAAMVKSPVFHVNGDDVESVVFCAQLAAEYRQKFHKDVFIDMVCYRLHGHNEGDDPKYTQPKMYEKIKNHPDPRKIYVRKLENSGDIDKELAEEMQQEFWSLLQDRLDEVKEKPLPYERQEVEDQWQEMRLNVRTDEAFPSPDTGVQSDQIEKVVQALIHIPDDFHPLRKVKKLLDSMKNNLVEEEKVDWAAAELLAYGTLMVEGHDVRMSGQDVRRGTFSHRHAVLHDEETEEEFNRLNYIDAENKGKFRIFNSLLSEFAVLGFEYGYSLVTPNSLNLWEAQFGDFTNGAQVIIDQFISAGESKWQKNSDVILLLPHGYEGQGPEHSSARLERFLQNSAEFNWSVVNITDPANYFHCLRRQLKRDYRKPLIVMSPKSLLRHPRVTSSMSELTSGSFQEIIDDVHSDEEAKNVQRILFCSGKIYYDLLAYQEENDRKDVALIRLEQLYPLHYDRIDQLLEKYSNAKPFWVQEEPSNMGPWTYILSCYRKIDWNLVSRKSSASPATGFKKVHVEEQERIIEDAFNRELN